MIQRTDKDAQNESRTVLSASEELRPIRIGMVAQQPGPDTRDIVYVGLASLLPDGLHALCACAGLFFARVLLNDDKQYHLEVAALSRYLDADWRTREWHVRTMELSADSFALLLEWDRSLAGKATCDVRELVEGHVAQVKRAQRPLMCEQVVELSETITEQTDQQPQAEAEMRLQHVPQDDPDNADAEVDLEIIAHLSVPARMVREVFTRLNITQEQDRCVHTAMLIAALDMIEAQLDGSMPISERKQLERQYDAIRSVQQWRRNRRQVGYTWQRVVSAKPNETYTQWDMTIGRPKDWKTLAA